MKSTYVGTRSANVGDIRCSFALASDSTTTYDKKMSETIKHTETILDIST